MRIGNGYDVHKLTEGRDLVLGGVKIDYKMGLLGHSDADVLTHAVMDALLGAAGMGDIGLHFPDTDDKYKDVSSMMLLEETMELLEKQNYKVVNVDATIIAQNPKLRPYINAMEENIASVIHCDISQVNIKATTEEHLGFTGREEGISATCACLIE
ncbi:MAG: 2-C-methyl-D-erythritol 2,4-cyclodiphosphate synthase [Lachnospiraceae bacterium]|nr:2-C-methyl-D-erythritol 2,4-cyclodiphosphate synthase [Lachnospiraceae bacterium]